MGKSTTPEKAAINVSPTENTPPGKLDLRVALPDTMPQKTQDELTKLRASIEKDLGKGTNLRRVATYCQTNGIDCDSWNGKGPLIASQLEEIKNSFSEVPAIRNQLIPLFTDPDSKQRIWARGTLGKIIELIKTQQSELKNFKEESTELKKDVCGEYLGGVGDRARETVKNNPWATILSAGVALYTTYLLYNHDTHGKWFKPIVQGGVLLGVGNFLSKLFIPNGKTALQNLQEWVQGTPDLGAKVSSFVDQFKDKGVDTGILQTSLQMGSIRFNAFLNAYKSARNGKMDMAALKRRAAGLNIPDDVFNESNGEGLYELMGQLCEKVGNGDKNAGLKKLEKDYGSDGKYKRFNFTEVAFAEGFTVDATVTDEVAQARDKNQKESGKGKATAVAAGAAGTAGAGKTPEAVKSTPQNSQEEELYEIPGFEGVDLELDSDKATATVCGYPLPYTRTIEASGAIHYKITDESLMTIKVKKEDGTEEEKQLEPRYFDFKVGPGADLEKSKTVLDHMNTYLRLKTAYLLKQNGLPVDANTLDYKQGVWMASYPGKLDPSLGGAANPSLALEVKPTSAGTVKISCNGHETSSVEFMQNIQNETLATVLSAPETSHADGSKSVNLLSGLSVKITSTKNGTIKGTAEGTPFECHYDLSKKEYVFTQIPLNATVIDKKVEATGSLSQFNALFENLDKSGEVLSPWLRGASDIFMSWTWMDAEWPDNTNDQWHAFVSFKRGEMLDLYRTELQKVKPDEPDAHAKMKLAYDATIGDFLVEFKNLPSELDAAQAVDDEVKAQEWIAKFRTFGYSSSYNTVRDVFVQKAEKMNFPGFAERSNAAHQRCFFFLQQQYTRLTAPLIRENFEPVAGNAYYDYDAYVQREIMAIMNRAEKNPTQVDGFLSKTWETFVRDGASWNELQQAKPAFDKILTFDRWQVEEHRFPELEAFMQAARPELKGHENMYSLKPIPGNAWAFEITWYPGKSYAFTAMVEVDPVTHIMEYRSLELSEQWINDHVEAIRTCPEFSDCFKDLSNQFNAVAGLFDNIEEGSWKSLVTYKQEEILTDYKRQLMDILYSKKSKTDQAREMDALHINFANRYLRDAKSMNDRLAKRVKECSKDSTKDITEGDFRNIYSGLERMGYTPDYFFLMHDARTYYEKFNYNGWDHPSVGVNAVMKLIYSKTAFMNEPGRHVKPEERAYFLAVQDKVDSVVLQAHANTKGTGSWFQSAIGHDEVPSAIDFPDFLTWYKSNSKAGEPIITMPTGKSFEVEQNRLSMDFNAIYETEYAKKVYPKYPNKDTCSDDYDPEVVKAQEIEREQLTGSLILGVLKDPTTEDTAKKDYTEHWKIRLKEAEDSWWIF